MDDIQQERHEMVFSSGEDGGADELYCPTCGRKLLVTWGPEFQKVVIAAGNETAIHSAGSGGLTMGSAELSQQEIIGEDDKARLEEWEGWLTEIDFSSWWR